MTPSSRCSRLARPIAWRTRSTNSARLGRLVTGIVERLVGELLLERLALADVARVQHDAAHVLVVEQVRVQDLELAQAAVAVTQRALDDLAVAPRVDRSVRQHPQETVGVLPDHEPIEAGAERPRRGE